MKQPLRLLGINLKGLDPAITKVLKIGWYPFGDYPKPKNDGYLYVEDVPQAELFTYHMNHNLPAIAVSCIVGKNGSGKSTIIDILYRIINNLAVRVLDNKIPKIESELDYAHGVYADLYFEVDGYIGLVRCNGDELEYYRYKKNKKSFPLVSESLSSVKKVLEDLFYTIGINYSLYAFNKEDYQSDTDKDINGEWLDGVFHKNDGYIAPITLVPYRENGAINIKQETILSQQRITALAILSRIKRRQFPEGYRPEVLHFSLSKNYDEEKLKKFTEKYGDACKKIGTKGLIDLFEEGWKWLFKTEKLNIVIPNGIEGNYAMFYLSYKAAKISLTYPDYKQVLDIDSSDLQTNIKGIVRTLWTTHDHITQKVHQCLYYLESKWWERYHDSIDVFDFINDEKLKTYDDVCKCLPPPFYHLDLTFRKIPIRANRYQQVKYWKDEKGHTFKLSAMSSCEKQMLTAVSYVLYHLRNLQSVWNTDFREKYHHVNIVFDEVELYFHPEYQRRFLSMLLEALTWTQIDKRRIRSINILIATHSPFILTDILTERTLYLKEGDRLAVKNQTFGGNYYDMLDSSFFFEDTAIGGISSKMIRGLTDKKKKHSTPISEKELNMVGDTFVRDYLLNTKDEDNNHVSD